jgi:3-methylcrotonyl-CoA carboxylase alpha subunit
VGRRRPWWRTALAAEAALEDADPWSRRDGWRLQGGAQRR